MAAGFYREAVKQLSLLGFERIQGGNGSHEKWMPVIGNKKLVVPRRLKSRHTANSILKTAGSKMRL